jgi:hypothetical protein
MNISSARITYVQSIIALDNFLVKSICVHGEEQPGIKKAQRAHIQSAEPWVQSQVDTVSILFFAEFCQ